MKSRPVGIPDVFADTDADRRVVEFQHGCGFAGLKVAELIEDAVIRQVHLVIDGHDLSVLNHGGSIEDIVLAIDKTYHGSDLPSRCGEFFDSPEIGVNELRLEKEV